MSSSYGQTPYPPGAPTDQPRQQYYSAYQYSHGYQDLRPPPIDTGHLSSSHPMNRSSPYCSSDSGYATRTPSVASPIPQQSYPIQSYPAQSYPAQGYPAQSYSGSRQQGASYSYGNQPSHDIELVHTLPVSSAKHKKERRQSTPSPPSPSEYPCLHPHCGHISSRAHDLKRHMTKHFPPSVDELLDCRYEWCGRTGAHGFKRNDHRKEHYRKVHMKENEYPKTGKGGSSGKSSGKSSL